MRIAIENKDAYTFPSESFIHTEGEITKPSILMKLLKIIEKKKID